MKIYAFLPARGGSKGLPRKNLRPMCGRPLIEHSIRAALGSKHISRLFVSTDDSDIAKVASDAGAAVLNQPEELSSDSCPSFPVIQWMLSQLAASHDAPDVCVILRATAPLRTSGDIDDAIDRFLESGSDSLASVTKAIGVSPQKLKIVKEDGTLTDAVSIEGCFPSQRQSAGTYYVRNEALYVVRPSVIRSGGLWSESCLAFEMPEQRSVNINTDLQFQIAEWLLQRAIDERTN